MNRTKTSLLFTLLILSWLNGFADVPYNAWWQKANRFYQEKNYDSAAAYYTKLAKLNPENPEIFYNLGNTYYRLNKIGFAVLNYEKALKLKPDYRQAQDNLELTQSRISNRIQQSPPTFFSLPGGRALQKLRLLICGRSSVFFCFFSPLLFCCSENGTRLRHGCARKSL